MTDQIAKDEFNQLCIRIMGYKPFDLDLLYDRNYNPYDDLNHMQDVFDKIVNDSPVAFIKLDVHPPYGIKFAMRDFIKAAVDGKVL